VDGGDGVRIVLRAPTEGPTAATHSPGANTEGRDMKIAVTELSSLHFQWTLLSRNPCMLRVDPAEQQYVFAHVDDKTGGAARELCE
jgi:hypothetical protein